ncbi:DUF3574 domain-containing protein [Deminuibacter soli]|uniref:DUF3574 domain-containing protein n=1 Tax=Deminuibacter soli TaxID=2291815 RepID=A0A3E1NNM6_9BACT|nr:DUF3574 domain-containing protein [Deminuibacter soli]RFM29520.1 DUF3574 domain-containing protein [Deminuibacter soli]
MKNYRYALLPLLLLCACTASHKSTETNLYFGMDIAHTGTVSDSAWQAFETKYILPVFPAGFTRLDANGVWRGDDHIQVTEHSRIIIALNKMSPQLSVSIDSIRAAYKRLFKQDAVMRVDKPAQVSF